MFLLTNGRKSREKELECRSAHSYERFLPFFLSIPENILFVPCPSSRIVNEKNSAPYESCTHVT